MQRMWLFGRKGPSGFSGRSTAEEVTQGIDGSRLTAIVTENGYNSSLHHTKLVGIEGFFYYGSDRNKVFGGAISGASSGLGVETTRVLALRGVHVVMGVRNLDAGRNVKQAIIKETPAALIDIMELELSSLASVRKFASEYTSSGLPLNILINNAGTMATSFALSEDGIELDFATNYLGHFLLTNLLLEIMKTTARESKTEGRIVNVSSMSHQITYSEGIRFNEINSQAGYRSLYAYGQSKLANILHANELARSLKEQGVNITVNSVHPGTIPTGLTRHLGLIGVFGNMVIRYVFKNVQQGAATTCYVALNPQVKRLTGQYFIDSNLAEPSFQAKDSEMAKKLWNLSIDMTNTK